MTTAATTEITFHDLLAAGCGGASRPVRVQTDAEAYEEHDEPALVSPGHFLGTVVAFASEALSESCWPEWEMTIGHKRGHVAVAVVKRVLVVGAKAAKVATVRSGNPASVLSAAPLAHGVELSASFGWVLGDIVWCRDLRAAIRDDVATMHERIRAAVAKIEAGEL